jgi:hypothetical protein
MQHCNAITFLSVCTYRLKNYRYIDIDKIEIAQIYHNFSHMYCVFCRILRASRLYRNCHGRDLMVNELTTICGAV